MTPKLKLVGFIVCAAVLGASQARAITYIYTGNDFTTIADATPPAGTYTTSESVSGSFTLLNPLSDNFSGAIIPTSFSFFDGRNTLTNSNATSAQFLVTTNSSGAIVNWQIQLGLAPTPLVIGSLVDLIESINTPGQGIFDEGQILSCTTVGLGCSGQADRGTTFSAGRWSSITTTPLPGTLPLFATGLGALGLPRLAQEAQGARLKATFSH